jgi:hypothetical protein
VATFFLIGQINDLDPFVHILTDDYELTPPDATNIKEYTLESLVFSFALMGAYGKLMGDNGELKDYAPSTKAEIVVGSAP